jgi:two-component system chemotaxis response regulator CheY
VFGWQDGNQAIVELTPMNSTPRVLVVDDEPTIRELIADALSEFGYAVEVAANGAEALEAMQHALPNAVVLDLMMPRVNGMGFVELMRLIPEFASVPVLLVTAAYGAHDMAERLGAKACLTKPFELDRLVELVGELTGSPDFIESFDDDCPTPTRTRTITEA